MLGCKVLHCYPQDLLAVREIYSDGPVDLFLLDDIFFKNVFLLSGGFWETICVLYLFLNKVLL